MASPVPLTLRDVRVGTIAPTIERGKENEATFHWPLGMAMTPQGDLLVANYLGHNIRLIDSKGIVTTYAGTGQQGFQNGHKESATFSGPSSIVLTPQGDLLVTDVLNNCLRKVSKDGSVTVFAGTGQQGFKNGPKEQATFFYPFGLIRTNQGALLVLDKGNHSIRIISLDGTVSTFAGCGQAGCKDGVKEKAMFNTPYGICLVPEASSYYSPSLRHSGYSSSIRSSSGGASMLAPPMELYVADSGNHRVCFIDNQGMVSTLAGVPGQAGFADGAKDIAKFNGPRSLLLTPHGDLLVSDQGNQRIRIVETNGLVSTFAGCDRAGLLDGPRERATFSSPSELCLAPSGDLYVSDFTNNKIRHIKCPMWDTTATKRATASSPHFSLESLIDDTCPAIMSDFLISLAGSRSKPVIKILYSHTEASSSANSTGDLSSQASVQVALGSYPIGRVWHLHKTVIANRCPSLLNPSTVKHIEENCDFSPESIDALVRYLYCDALPTELSISHLCDLDYVFNMCELNHMSDHVRWIIDQRLNEIAQVTTYIDLLGHIARHCGGSPVLVDLIVARMRGLRSSVAEHMDLIFKEFSQSQPLLIQVVAKLLGESPLEAVENLCTYSILTNDINECSHFGEIAAQMERLFESDVKPTFELSETSYSSEETTEAAQEEESSKAPLVIAKTIPCPPDFTIIVEGQKLQCHKSILYGRWPYFAGAMKLGGVEFLTNSLEIPDDTFSPSLMRCLLEYFYSNKVSSIESDDDCITVLKHSLQFGFVDSENEPQSGFNGLMSHCRRPLAKPLSPSNCVGVLNTVLQYGNAHQQYKVRSFVARVLPDIMNDDKLAVELEALGPAENMRILFEQYGRQTASPLRGRPGP